MARIWSSGFELNSTTANVEWTSFNTGITIQTSTVRSGTYAMKNSGLSASNQYVSYQFASSDQLGLYYFRFYINIETFPSGGSAPPYVFSTANTSNAFKISLRMTNASKLRLTNNEAGVQIGSDSAVLNTGQWYRVELKVDTSTLASTMVDARIDGVSFASGTVSQATGQAKFFMGSSFDTTNQVWYFDDVAINDSTGSVQNSWPGDGSIVHLRPSAAGDNTTWAPTSGTNFSNVSEVTPNDGTSTVRSATAPHLDDYNIDDPSGDLDTNATVNVIQVGARYNGNNATQSLNPKFKVRFKAAAAGTVSESAEIQPSATAYTTNANAAPRNYPLTLYANPDASTITSTTLTSSQLGGNLSTTGNGAAVVNISTLWLLVDYSPSGGGGGLTAIGYKTLLGVGQV